MNRFGRYTGGVLLAAIVIASGTNAAQAQEMSHDLTELSLEQLLEQEVSFLDVNVMGGHTHRKGEWMLGYRFMFMEMNGYRDGTHHVSIPDVLQDFRVAPLRMSMQMTMAELMYSPTDDLTLMAMFPHKVMKMDHVRRDRTRFTARIEGIGDISLMALYTVWRGEDRLKGSVFRCFLDELSYLLCLPTDTGGDHEHIHLQGGLSFPTGDIDQLSEPEYLMQLGSGTWDLLPGVTYLGHTEWWGWGVHVDGMIRTGENDHLYALGNRSDVSAWLTRKWNECLSSNVRLAWQHWGDIRGMDVRFDPTRAPTTNPGLYGGDRIDVLLGLTLYESKGKYKGNRLGIEFGVPIYQSLQGPQLETDWMLQATWSWTFVPVQGKKPE